MKKQIELLTTEAMAKKEGIPISTFYRAMNIGLLTPDYWLLERLGRKAVWNPKNRKRFEVLKQIANNILN